MPEIDKALQDIFGEMIQICEKEILEFEKKLVEAKTIKKFIPDSPNLFDVQIMNGLGEITECLLKESLSRSKSDKIVLETMYYLFLQAFNEINSLKNALQSVGADVSEVRASIKKREEIFGRIEKITEEIAKKDEAEREKWR